MANTELLDEGSRKHILDLVESTGFRSNVNRILRPTGFRLADQPHIHPYGREDQAAWTEFELEEYLSESQRRIGNLPLIKDDWWIAHKVANNRRPTWDLIAHLRTLHDDGALGLLLVEAKAHASELKIKDSKNKPSKTLRSQENDKQIRRRIQQTNTLLRRQAGGRFALSADDHYQLANRVSYAAHVANLGYHVVLLYLGFSGDTYFNDPIHEETHWHRLVGGYLQGVVPQSFPEAELSMTDAGSIFLHIASLPALNPPHRGGAT